MFLNARRCAYNFLASSDFYLFPYIRKNWTILNSSAECKTTFLDVIRNQNSTSELNAHKRKISSLYMRKFDPPEDVILFRSREGQLMLSQAIQRGEAEVFFSLAEQFLTQAEPPSCGPASLVMVMNSLKIDPQRPWRGPWRWVSEDTLVSCDKSLVQEKLSGNDGVDLNEFAFLAECNGCAAQTFFADISTLQCFRELLISALNSPRGNNVRIVVAYSRSHLKQTGSGHYSPVAAYNKSEDMVLILDVARFKYPPYWVKLSTLWQAMMAVDKITGRSRGFAVLAKEFREENKHHKGHFHRAKEQFCEGCEVPVVPKKEQKKSPCIGIENCKEDIEGLRSFVKHTVLSKDGDKTWKVKFINFMHDARFRLARDPAAFAVDLEKCKKSLLHDFLEKELRGSNSLECASNSPCFPECQMRIPKCCFLAFSFISADSLADVSLFGVILRSFSPVESGIAHINSF